MDFILTDPPFVVILTTDELIAYRGVRTGGVGILFYIIFSTIHHAYTTLDYRTPLYGQMPTPPYITIQGGDHTLAPAMPLSM